MSFATRPLAVTHESALRRLSEHLHGIAEAVAEMAIATDDERRRPHLVGREPEDLLTIAEAVDLLGDCDRRTVHRFAKRHPEVVRHVGSLVRYERVALLRATRKG